MVRGAPARLALGTRDHLTFVLGGKAPGAPGRGVDIRLVECPGALFIRPRCRQFATLAPVCQKECRLGAPRHGAVGVGGSEPPQLTMGTEAHGC